MVDFVINEESVLFINEDSIPGEIPAEDDSYNVGIYETADRV